jgi:hypothetical protein
MTSHETEAKPRRGVLVSAILVAMVASALAGCVLARSDRDDYGYDRDRDYRYGNYGYRVPDRDYPYRDRDRDYNRERERDYNRDYRRGEYPEDHEGPGIR